MISYLALGTALLLSIVSGYYSIVGLTALFAGAFYPVLVMGSALEIGKLVTASWLYNNWNITPLVVRFYLTIAVITLMLISSMGIFGFLSKAYIEHSVSLNSGAKQQVQIIDTKIKVEQQSLSNIDTQIAQIDSALSKLTERGQASSSLRAAEQQRKTRDNLASRKDQHVRNISTLTQQRIASEGEAQKLEAEVGPIRYIADVLLGKSDHDTMDRAVRIVIGIIVAVFDPLAVVLLIAANIGIRNRRKTVTGALVIDETVFKGESNSVPT